MVRKIEEVCPACLGKGIQINKDKVKVQCPVCTGSGKFNKTEVERSINEKFGLPESAKILIENADLV